MTVYVDKAKHRYGRMIMSHMLADDLAELHAMAEAIGMKRAWFQPRSTPHYDVSREHRMAALKLGAIEIDRPKVGELIKMWRKHYADLRAACK